eukprot:9475510-Pyramimonas_sp.AAC.2
MSLFHPTHWPTLKGSDTFRAHHAARDRRITFHARRPWLRVRTWARCVVTHSRAPSVSSQIEWSATQYASASSTLPALRAAPTPARASHQQG